LHVQGTAVISDQEPTRQVRVVAADYTSAEQISNVAHNVVQMLAIILGGTWAYLKFVRGRTFKPRGELKIDGALRIFDEDPALLVQTTFTNAGLSRILLPPNQAFLLVDWLPSGYWGPGAVVWEPVMMPSTSREDEYAASLPDDTDSVELMASVFDRDRSVEPGEVITDHQLVIIPSDESAGFPLAFRVRAIVASRRRFMRRSSPAWTTSMIVPASMLGTHDGLDPESLKADSQIRQPRQPPGGAEVGGR
jgi:hypothetical protein